MWYPATQSILLYIEGIGNARSFMSGLRAAARLKPVVVVKVGRHSEGSRAAMSHTGALVGSDDVFDAALRRAGVVRAMTIEQLFSAAQLLATHNRIKGNRLAIVTNGGGPGVMATDRAIDLDLSLAQLDDSTVQVLNTLLPEHSSHSIKACAHMPLNMDSAMMLHRTELVLANNRGMVRRILIKRFA